jgi:ABC-2 type transport system permease protein
MTDSLRRLGYLARRSTVRTFRHPATVIPTVAFPLILLLVIGSGLTPSASIPGFPAESYLDFALAGVFMHAGMLAGLNAGTDLASDLETGFLTRLSLTPMRRWQLLLGQLAGAMVFALFHGVVFLGLGLVLGVEFRSGPVGVLVLLALGVVGTLGFSGISAFLAVRTKSSEVVRGLFPMFFVVLTFSSYFLPRDLIDIAWFRAVATANPLSYLIEGARSLIIEGWEPGPLLLAFAVGAAIIVVTVTGAAAGLRSRMVTR